jgi:hypothetical protein
MWKSEIIIDIKILIDIKIDYIKLNRITSTIESLEFVVVAVVSMKSNRLISYNSLEKLEIFQTIFVINFDNSTKYDFYSFKFNFLKYMLNGIE